MMERNAVITPAILRRKQLQQYLSVSCSTIYARLDKNSSKFDPRFPRPISLGPRAVGWIKTEVDAYLASRVEQRVAA